MITTSVVIYFNMLPELYAENNHENFLTINSLKAEKYPGLPYILIHHNLPVIL